MLPDRDRSGKMYINIVALLLTPCYKKEIVWLTKWRIGQFCLWLSSWAMLAFGGLTDLDNRWIQARSDLIK